jgi:tetratricopeptide (TPR) repeat protein
MLNLRELVLKMKEDDFKSFSRGLKESKAEKHLLLTEQLRDERIREEDIIRTLDLSSNGYYTIKSRLYQKIKEFMSAQLSYPKADLYVNISHIPNLIYNTAKNEAILILTKLEKDLLKNDMPQALTIVYSALKKIHADSRQYFHYSQQYNKNLAYTATIEKAEELLVDFNRTLGEYYVSRGEQYLDVLQFIKNEMNAISRQYDSHHLKMYKLILDISLAVTIPGMHSCDEEAVEDMLASMDQIFKSFPNDPVYQHLDKAYHYLAFEYYHGLGIHKKAAVFLEVINETLPSFLLYNFCVLPSKILISKLEHYLVLKKQQLLFGENKELVKEYEANPESVVNFINYSKYLAVSAIYSQEYQEAINHLNHLISQISFRNYIHADIEIKLLLVMCNSMVNRYDIADTTLKSAIRKINETENDQYENAKHLSKLLQMQTSSVAQLPGTLDKMLELRNKFLSLNNGKSRMLEWLNLSDDFIRALGKPVKGIK